MGVPSMAKKQDKLKRMKERPYYAVLHAINFIKGRLPEDVEVALGSDPHACLLYAERVMKGRLPDHLHNRMVIGIWTVHEKDSVERYLRIANLGEE